jgi:hypothetical protein
LLIGFLLIAFKSQLSVSAVIRVPLQDIYIHLIQIHLPYLELCDQSVCQTLAVCTMFGKYISKLVAVYSLANHFLFCISNHLKKLTESISFVTSYIQKQFCLESRCSIF